MAKVFCEKHSIEYEDTKTLSFGDIKVKCPKCAEEQRLLEISKREEKERERYIEEVKWRMEVSWLPKIIINTKLNINLVPDGLRDVNIKNGLFLYGQAGMGKTMYLKYLICKNYKNNFTYLDCIAIKNYTFRRMQSVYETLESTEFVILDELQAVDMETFTAIVEIVYNADGVFILCGNFSLEGAKHFINNLPQRVKSRLLSKKPLSVMFEGVDKRMKGN